MAYSELCTQKREIESGTTSREAVRLPRTAEALFAWLKGKGFETGTAVFWEMQHVVFGKWQDGALLLPGGEMPRPELWLELRVFDARRELHLRTDGEELAGRFVEDDAADGTASRYLDAMARLWGKRDTVQDGFLCLTDAERKLSLLLPAPAEEATYYGLVTRNYITANEKTAQAGFTDFRYLAIAPADMGEA